MIAFEESLECGTSLAEREHGGEDLPFNATTQFSELAGDSSSRSQRETECLEEGKAQMKKPSTVQSVSSLRTLLAQDVLTSEFFHSPFEQPQQPGSTTPRAKYRLPVVYCDQTASNRPLRSIESYLQNVCLPLYGNTHTNTSITGSQSTAFCAEARQLVAETCNAKITGKASLDVVLFAYV